MLQRIFPILFCPMLVCAAFLPRDAHAAGSKNDAGPNVETEQRLRQDVQLMLSQLATSGAFGEHPEQPGRVLSPQAPRLELAHQPPQRGHHRRRLLEHMFVV